MARGGATTATTYIRPYKQAAGLSAVQTMEERFAYGLNPQKLAFNFLGSLLTDMKYLLDLMCILCSFIPKMGCEVSLELLLPKSHVSHILKCALRAGGVGSDARIYDRVKVFP